MTSANSYGTPFAETEILLAAQMGDVAEVVKRVNALFPSERKDLIDACELIVGVCEA